MALMGSDQAKLDQNDQARAVLDWLSSEGAQNLLRQVSADRAQTADKPDIQRGQEEVQRRRDTAVHDWLNTPEAQRFLMGRGDADIAMRQQGQRGPGSGMGPQPQHPGSMGFTPEQPFQGGPHPAQMQTDRQRMLEELMASGRGNPDYDRGPYTPGAFQQVPRGQSGRGPYHQGPNGNFSMLGLPPPPGMIQPRPQLQGPGYGPPGAGSPQQPRPRGFMQY